MVLEINHHWVTFKLPGNSNEFRARYKETASEHAKFEVEKKTSDGRWVSAFSRIVTKKPKAK